MEGVIHSVNVSEDGGVPKFPIRAAIVRYEGMEGDHNRFRAERRGGDPRRAINIFSLERIGQLQDEGHSIEVGSTGENITIEGMDWDALEVGMVLRVGEATIQLSEPCAPCSKIEESFVDGRFARVDHEQEFGWSRWLASVLEEGMVSTGDMVSILAPGEN
ncbi:MAG: MOSC domain-containing protein [Candidatus Thermoplasmatota archaeon]|nr:MOSC domain-containing protein [Candidatus Thermoplasmatota archaeon]